MKDVHLVCLFTVLHVCGHGAAALCTCCLQHSQRLSCAELNLLFSYERRTTVHRIFKWGRCFVGHWVYFSWLYETVHPSRRRRRRLNQQNAAMRKIYHKFIRIFTLRLVANCILCAVMHVQNLMFNFYSNLLVPIFMFTYLFGRKTPIKRNNHMGG